MQLPASVQAKLDGAQEHFDGLIAEIDAYAARKPYRFTPDHNAELTEHYLWMEMAEPFPSARWGHAFGDFLQDLRSALDHLVYAIDIHENGIDPPKAEDVLEFPIWTNPPDQPMWKVASLSTGVQAAIKREQPDPNNMAGSVLWQLHKFNRADKHRVIHFAVLQPEHSVVAINVVKGNGYRFTMNNQPLESKAPFITVYLDRPQSNVKMRSMGVGQVCVQRIGGNGAAQDFLPLPLVGPALRNGTLGVIERVATVAGL